MDAEKRERLLAAFLEGRISPEQESELEKLLLENPELGAELRGQAALHALLAARRDSLQRKESEPAGGKTPIGFLARVRSRLPGKPSPSRVLQPPHGRPASTGKRRTWRSWAAWGTAAAAILFAGFGWWLSREGPPPATAPLATLRFAGEGVTVLREGKTIPADAGFELFPKDIVRTPVGGGASLVYGDDQTRVELSEGTEIRLEESLKAKAVMLRAGTLRAEVAHQPPGFPMIFRTLDARAEILGTRILLRTETRKTRLEVETGEVRLVRETDQKGVLVPAGHFAEAGPDFELAVHPLPAPSRLYRVVPSSSLWAEYSRSPDTHPNIPNCSYSGYRYGEAAIPDPPVVANVRTLGAAGDGKTDDTPAFRSALLIAREKGGGAILIPQGKYRLTSLLHLDHSGLVLRGEGAQKTILEFDKSLTELLGAFPGDTNDSRWGWTGGLIWVSPPGTFGSDGEMARRTPTFEEWVPGERLADLTQGAKRGDATVQVSPEAGSRLRPGEMVLLTWSPGRDLAFFQHIAGHELMTRDYDWAAATELVQTRRFCWPVEILRVEGGKVTLRQPLRLDARPEWKVGFESLGPSVNEIGIERLTVRLHSHPQARHRMEPGYNGIYFNRALHSWVREVTVENSEMALGVAYSKCILADHLRVTGQKNHHGITFRASSHDCMATDFEILALSLHGISAEALSSGLVFRRGLMNHGTFDSQRGMPFDLLRTNITIKNDGWVGGTGAQGPRYGARVVHWNIRASGQSEWVNDPETISMGALVGIQGVDLSLRVIDGMPSGYKDCIVGDLGGEPTPPDLYEAELNLRLGRKNNGK